MVSIKRRFISRAYDLLFSVVNYEWFFQTLGRAKAVRSNSQLRSRVISEFRYAMSKQGVGKKQRPVTLANSLRIADCDFGDYVELNLFLFGGYSEDEQTLLTKHLHEGDLFIDVGANIGVFTLIGAQIVGTNGAVIAVEPAHDTMQKLLDNVALNNFESRVEILEIALSDENSHLPIYGSAEETQDLGKRSFFQEGALVDTVPVRVFDDLVKEKEIDIDRPIGAIKIDVEGAELMVLRGMETTIRSHRPRIIVFEVAESHLERADVTVAELESFMQSIGYQELTHRNPALSGLAQNVAYIPVS